MLGSNPSAAPGPKTEAGCHEWHPVSFASAFTPRDWAQGEKSRGLGGWPPSNEVLSSFHLLPTNSAEDPIFELVLRMP